MPQMPKVHHPRGMTTAAERARLDHDRRGNRHEQGYTNAWGRARRRFLDQHRLCVMCFARGRLVPADVVDHIVPHRGNQALFWDETNWQALCAACHNGPKRRQENAERRAQGKCVAHVRAAGIPGAAGAVGLNRRGGKTGNPFAPEARPSAQIFAPVSGATPSRRSTSPAGLSCAREGVR